MSAVGVCATALTSCVWYWNGFVRTHWRSAPPAFTRSSWNWYTAPSDVPTTMLSSACKGKEEERQGWLRYPMEPGDAKQCRDRRCNDCKKTPDAALRSRHPTQSSLQGQSEAPSPGCLQQTLGCPNKGLRPDPKMLSSSSCWLSKRPLPNRSGFASCSTQQA